MNKFLFPFSHELSNGSVVSGKNKFEFLNLSDLGQEQGMALTSSIHGNPFTN